MLGGTALVSATNNEGHQPLDDIRPGTTSKQQGQNPLSRSMGNKKVMLATAQNAVNNYSTAPNSRPISHDRLVSNSVSGQAM
jgi:hypothetical protein